jgi:hypothetical protein
VDAAAADLQKEEDVKALQQDRLHREEVDRQDLLGVLADELAPGALAAAWGRQESVLAQDVAYGAVRAAAAHLQEFALDASVPPPRVLAGKMHDQLLALGALPGSTAWWSPSVQRPLPMDQLPVPAQQRLGADQEGPPGRARKHAAEGAQEQAVGRPEARPMDLAFEDAELVAEGKNLDLECGFGLSAENKEIEQRADDGVKQAQDHGRGSWRLGRSECWRCRCRGDHRGRSTFLNSTRRALKISRWSSTSRRQVPTNLSAIEFARGAWYGSLKTSTPSERKTWSKPALNLESRSRSRNLALSACRSAKRRVRVRQLVRRRGADLRGPAGKPPPRRQDDDAAPESPERAIDEGDPSPGARRRLLPPTGSPARRSPPGSSSRRGR